MGYCRTLVLLVLVAYAAGKQEADREEFVSAKKDEVVKASYAPKGVLEGYPFPAKYFPGQSPNPNPLVPQTPYTKNAPVSAANPNRLYHPQPDEKQLGKIVWGLMEDKMLDFLKQELPWYLNPCEKEYTYFPHTKKCYYSPEHDIRTWYAARDQCKALGATLCSFTDRYTQIFISQQCVRRHSATPAAEGWCWVGAKGDGRRSAADAFVEWLDGTKWVHTDPDTVESYYVPTTGGGVSPPANTDCLYVATDEIGAGFEVCSKAYNYICCKDPLKKPSPPAPQDKRKYPPINMYYPYGVPIKYNHPPKPHVTWHLDNLPYIKPFDPLWPQGPPKQHPYNLDPSKQRVQG